MNEPDVYIFDLDGTIFVGNKLLPYVRETIGSLKKSGKKIYYLTNTSIRSREQLVHFLADLGLDVEFDEVVTASYVAGWYFHRRMNQLKEKTNVLVIGEDALRKDLKSWGVPITQEPHAASHLLIGIDFSFDYDSIMKGMQALDTGATLVAVNPDPNCPVDGGKRIPDTGTFTAALETASQTKEKIIIGKPSPIMGQYFHSILKEKAKECIFIGDRIETDIQFGKANQMQTALVLTGAATKKALQNSPIKPDYVWETLGELETVLAF